MGYPLLLFFYINDKANCVICQEKWTLYTENIGAFMNVIRPLGNDVTREASGMCTSIAWKNGDFYFGRNLDLEVDFGQQVVMMPRNHPIRFRMEKEMMHHYAMMGMATVLEGCPLYADAVNEKGLCVAGLNYPGNAWYAREGTASSKRIAPFELPWWLLGQCATAQEARELLADTLVMHLPFGDAVPVSPLHWHVADRRESLVIECMADGMHILDNPAGVLTNSPPFDFHMHNLCQYMNLTALQAENRFTDEMELRPFGRGLGSFGLPGDASPSSRFVRAAFLTHNSVCEESEDASVAHFFHLLDAVAMTRGSVMAPNGDWEHTLYSCCVNADQGVYYYKTYGNSRLTAVHLRGTNLDGEALTEYPLEREPQIHHAN